MKREDATFFGRTLCGHDIGSESEGWFRNAYARSAESSVTCRRCRLSMAPERSRVRVTIPEKE